jgi:hypothetical protein
MPSWVEYSGTNAPSNGGRRWFNGIDGQWAVPAKPTTDGAIIYFFNGLVDKLDPNNHTEIIQPVLQYGKGPNGGGNYWVISSWWVRAGTGNYLYTNPIRVNVGDTIYGIVAAGSGDCNASGQCSLWAIEVCGTSDCSKASTNAILFLSSTDKSYQRAYQGVLEAYNVTTCNYFPSDGAMAFGSTHLYQPPATGSLNQYVEMYNSATWSTPSLNTLWNQGPHNCSFGGGVFSRGTTLDY